VKVTGEMIVAISVRTPTERRAAGDSTVQGIHGIMLQGKTAS